MEVKIKAENQRTASKQLTVNSCQRCAVDVMGVTAGCFPLHYTFTAQCQYAQLKALSSCKAKRLLSLDHFHVAKHLSILAKSVKWNRRVAELSKVCDDAQTETAPCELMLTRLHLVQLLVFSNVMV